MIVFVNIDEGKIIFNKNNIKKNVLKNGKEVKEEKEIINKITQNFKNSEKNEKYDTLKDKNKLNNYINNYINIQINYIDIDSEFQGNDYYFRNIFKYYFLNYLTDISLINHISTEISLDNETKLLQIKKIIIITIYIL